MNTYNSLAAALAMVAAGAPLVSQAQDPMEAYKNVSKLRQAGNNAEALKLTDQILNVYANPKSRVAKQFAHLTPFFYFQKGEILVAMGELDKAYETFHELNTKELFKDNALLERSKELAAYKAEGYAPFLSLALFQMGYIRYQQAVGRDGKEGDPSKFDDAISLLEEYLKNYDKRKVTKMEQSQKLDGKVCFLLMQAYLLKPQPDFAKAGAYVEKGRKAKATLPDDMVINGLKTVLAIALENPDYVEWGEKMISSNPGSYHLNAVRMAPHSAVMCNYGLKAAKIWEDALRAGNMKQVIDAARTTYSLFGLAHDTNETVYALESQLKLIGGAGRPLPDKNIGVTYDPAKSKKLSESYSAFVSNNTEPEAYALLTLANSANQMGSSRLAKAGYKVLLDRYPGMKQPKKTDSGTEYTELRDINYLQYAQLSRATGDEETAVKYEQMIDPSKVGDGNLNAVVLNKMARLVKEKKWAEVVPVTDEVMQVLSAEKGSANYVTANFSKLAALYMLHRYDEVVKVGDALISSGMLQGGKLKDKQAREYETQSFFFVVDAAKELASTDATMMDKAVATADEFIKRFPSLNLADNPVAPNVYFDAINVLLKRRGHGKPEADQQDLDKAFAFCEVIIKNWPENDLYPTALLLGANIIMNGEDDSKKPEGIDMLELCYNAALKQAEGKGKSVASNALYWLASYAPEYPREGEDDAAVRARVAKYFDTFWKDADYEGNSFALQMASLQLMRALDAKDAGSYDKAIKNAQAIIGREATYAFNNNSHDPELEKAINTYVDCYVNGEKQLYKKDLSLEEKTAHLRNFPGILKDDKYTNAILHMALLTSMNEAMIAAKRAGNNDLAAKLERDISQSFRQMRDSFKPTDLTNFICVQVGNYEVDYARRLQGNDRKQEAEMAIAYFNQVLERGRDMVREATLGKAHALSLSEDAAHRKEAYELYSKMASATDPAIVGPALMGLTDLNLSTKNYKAAVESASKFMNVRGGGTQRDRLTMMMKLAEAYCESGEVQKGLQTYMNLYVQNRGNISFSAPACKAMMEQYWKRNNPATGDRLKGNFKPSDRWLAWNTGQSYVTQIRKAGIDAKMTPGERDLFNEVTILLDQYSKDRAVQEEDRANATYRSQIGK